MQELLKINGEYDIITERLKEKNIDSLFLVCDESINFLSVKSYFDNLTERTGIRLVCFSNFKPNPRYESVEEGVKLFLQNKCGAVFAVGGGSAMDVAKCVKLYASADQMKNYLSQNLDANSIPLFAMPTTAGTGSEATRFAVIYYNGEKQSVAHESILPSTVIMDPSVLKTLPEYQKKSTMLDALCHAVESFWSVNSTDESKEYSREAIKSILANIDGYLQNTEEGNEGMLFAAHTAGKAINITQTTAGHAMCYKLTSLYGISHGHAAALCVCALWEYMLKNTDKCIDPRGKDYLENIFAQIADAFGCESAVGGADKFVKLFSSLDLKTPEAKESDYSILVSSVNPVRLKNNPVALDGETILKLYKKNPK